MSDGLILRIFVGENSGISYNCDLDSAIEKCSKDYPNWQDKIQIYESDRYDRLGSLLAERVDGTWQYNE